MKQRARTWQRLFIRAIAILSCLVALAGLGGTVYVSQQVDGAETAARQRLEQLGDSVARIATALNDVSSSAVDAAGTVESAQQSLSSAATATAGAAGSLDQMGDISGLLLPGVQASFRDQAQQLRQLADQLEQTGLSLNQNAADLREIGADVRRIAGDMDLVARQLHQLAGDHDTPGSLSQLISTPLRVITSMVVLLLLLLFGIGVALYLLTTEAWLGGPPSEPVQANSSEAQRLPDRLVQ